MPLNSPKSLGIIFVVYLKVSSANYQMKIMKMPTYELSYLNLYAYGDLFEYSMILYLKMLSSSFLKYFDLLNDVFCAGGRKPSTYSFGCFFSCFQHVSSLKIQIFQLTVLP